MTVPKQILITIADDDLDDQMIIKNAIHELPYPTAINAVYTGLQLLDLLLKREAYSNNQESPDVIFLDLNMPLLDGLHTLKQIRSYPDLEKLPIYILSTSSQDYDRQRALEYGATGFFTKPAYYEQYKSILKEVLEKVSYT